MPVATLTSKGQITIPATVREQLGLKTGDRVDFALTPDGRVTMTPQRTRFEEVSGILRKASRRPVSVREMDRGIERAVAERWKRSARRPRR